MNQLLRYGLSINEFMSTNCCKQKFFLHILTFEIFLCRGHCGDKVGELTFHYFLRTPDPAIEKSMETLQMSFLLGSVLSRGYCPSTEFRRITRNILGQGSFLTNRALQ